MEEALGGELAPVGHGELVGVDQVERCFGGEAAQEGSHFGHLVAGDDDGEAAEQALEHRTEVETKGPAHRDGV